MKVVFIACLFGLASADVIVNTRSGPVRGTNSLSNDVDAFLGIPFAEPPVEDLRFAKPVPKKPWKRTYNATSLPSPCTQYSLEPYYFMPDVTDMSENCLYLNLWVPTTNYSYGLRPVVIFIHGGAFSTGSTNMKVYDGSKFASRGNLIVATINYRLGAFGYFLAYIGSAAGNMGTYDQIMAMKWIKDNARNFGGDPENIVLMGESAGAFSISLHMISPLSKNLFKRAILESGSGIQPILYDDNAKLYRNSQSVASITGCANETSNLKTDPHSVVDCLKRCPKEAIVEAEKIILKTNPVVFFPAVNDEVLPKSSVDLFLEGMFRKNIDVLIGINRDEGTMMMTTTLPQYFGHYGKNNVQTISRTRAKVWARGELMMSGQTNSSEVINSYAKSVKNRTSLGYTHMLANMIGDFIIACGTLFLADFLSLKGNSVYFYKFGFRAASTPMAEWVGVTHMDELQYVFGNPFHETFPAEEIELSNRLMDRWSAFARTGNPNIPNHLPWLRYSYHNKLYMNFGQEEETIRMDPISRCEIWRERFRANFEAAQIRFLQNSSRNRTLESTT